MRSVPPSDFTRYDEQAVQQINRNIDLLRYRRFGPELLALQLVHRTSDLLMDGEEVAPAKSGRAGVQRDKPVEQALEDAEPAIKDLFAAVRTFIMALGDDVQEKRVKLYIAYQRIKNFTCIVVQKKVLVLYLKLDPTTVLLEEGFPRDVREIGHWGTGDLEVSLRTMADLKRAESLIAKAYEVG